MCAESCVGLEEVLRASPDGLAVFAAAPGGTGSAELIVEYLNPVAAVWLNTHVREAVGAELCRVGAGGNEPLAELATEVIGTGRPRRLRVHRPVPGGGERVGEVGLAPLGERRVIATVRDVGHLVADEVLLSDAYERTAAAQATLRAAVDAISDSVAVYDVERDSRGEVRALCLVQVNASGTRGLGAATPEVLVGRDLREIYPRAVETGLWAAVLTGVASKSTQVFRLREVDPSGACTGLWDNTIAPAGTDRVVITWRDVTDVERRERQLVEAKDRARFAATHDSLTGLANRTLLRERLSEALAGSSMRQRVAVVYLDLDDFKQVNDRFGHGVGDALLRAIGSRLVLLSRSGDTVARLGGDEFVVVLRDLLPTWEPSGFVARARVPLERPLVLPRAALQPRASLGVAIAPGEGRDVDRVLCAADHAMYQDKAARNERANRPGQTCWA